MKLILAGVLGLALAASTIDTGDRAAGLAVNKGAAWLVAVQGHDGGWGQDGGGTSHIRTGERLESNGNDPANTAVAIMALMRAGHTTTRGQYQTEVRRGVDFLLRNVEAGPAEGLAVTSITGTQIQRKLGPYIDTFVTSMVLGELDGNMGDAASNARVRRALEKVVGKIQKHQQGDGSWNLSGGWAPVLGTSMASRGLYLAQQKGVKVESRVIARADDYAKRSAKPAAVGGAAAEAAGIALYQGAQALEQLSRTSADREKNADEIRGIAGQLRDERFVRGFGSMGGEEFFSYLNISDSLKRAGGKEWSEWNTGIKARLVSLQNQDGTWAGHHCITGRVAVTSAAMLTLLSERAS